MGGAALHRGMCGTPNYLAPELLAGAPPTEASEVWSLGCVLYAMLAGKPPFEADGVAQTYERVKQGKYRMPSSISPEAQALIIR